MRLRRTAPLLAAALALSLPACMDSGSTVPDAGDQETPATVPGEGEQQTPGAEETTG